MRFGDAPATVLLANFLTRPRAETNLVLRVLPTIFDPTLKTHFFLTDGARPNSFFLLKQLTQKLYADSISADSTLTSGSSEQLKIKTSNAIGFRYRRAEGS